MKSVLWITSLPHLCNLMLEMWIGLPSIQLNTKAILRNCPPPSCALPSSLIKPGGSTVELMTSSALSKTDMKICEIPVCICFNLFAEFFNREMVRLIWRFRSWEHFTSFPSV